MLSCYFFIGKLDGTGKRIWKDFKNGKFLGQDEWVKTEEDSVSIAHAYFLLLCTKA